MKKRETLIYTILLGSSLLLCPLRSTAQEKKTATTEEKATFQAGGLLTLNAGVGWEFLAIDESSIFGFLGSGLQPFDCGRFFSSSEVMTE